MAAAACGSSADTSTDTATESTDAEHDLTSGDQKTSRVETESTDAMSDSSEFGEPATVVSDEMTEAEPESADGGGFFGSEPNDELTTFEEYGVRPFVSTSRDPLSTFALDVDTGAYTVGRSHLNNGQLPPSDSVRVEEYVNFFDYNYRSPSDGLAMEAEGSPSPFDENNVVVRIGVQAEQVSNAQRPDASLVFVVDTSGSMDQDNRLGLVRRSLKLLVDELDRHDQVAIVTYSNDARVLLEPTSVGDDKAGILDAIDSLTPNGSTNLEAGLQKGYELAGDAFIDDGINRVILASDGIANVGLTDPTGLSAQIRDDADRGIHLVTVGVGMNSYNDVVMEQLADDGDGFYSYVDTDEEAEKLFRDDLVGTLLTVAIDGKIQVEFDEDRVEQYRLIGFENRAVLDNDFRNDAVDAGELGAGHQVTAIYELTLVDGVSGGDTLGTASLRWEDPDSHSVTENQLEITASMIEDRWSDTSEDYRLAVTVASFAELLRGSPYAGDLNIGQVQTEAEKLSGISEDAAEFARLVAEAARRM